ncbi:Rab family GTPase [Cellulophaga sp. Z1A5H]|uniref:Rab family GTPase n=1 Tax=Cellulophaga sp. Z1A5H TaxID=2687291 RepID=UPI0013FD8A42|nr:Rab family GTPase [Cellulophaga sp. Z1A5H]
MQVSKKIVVLGHFGVGKTSLIRRFVEDSFSDNYKVSIGVHITKKVVAINPEEKVSLILWDLEGTDDLTTIRDAYLLGTHGVVFVFDVTRPSTFQALNSDLDIVKTKIASIPLLVVGNKVDLVLKEDLEKLFKNNNIETNFLTSAKTGDTVNDLFLHLAKLLH